MIHELDINFNFDDALSYYHTLEKDYQHLKWTTTSIDDVNDAELHSLDGAFGWGIQSNLEDLTKPCPPYNVHKDGSSIYRDTELVFGFVKKLKDFFGPVRQLGIAGHPPGVNIKNHIDNPEYFKIHIPLLSNDKSYFNFEDRSYVLEIGKIYLIDTELSHGTSNLGNTTRVHLLFKLPIAMKKQVLKLTGSI